VHEIRAGGGLSAPYRSGRDVYKQGVVEEWKKD
jgi:hypothetical protein